MSNLQMLVDCCALGNLKQGNFNAVAQRWIKNIGY